MHIPDIQLTKEHRTMKSLWKNPTAWLAMLAVLLLAACNGSDDDPVLPPVAIASASAESVDIGTAVTLDGSASTTPNDGPITYQWSFSSRPEGSTAVLSSTTDASPGFTPDLPGSYVIDLAVNDGTASASARVTVAVLNPDPVALIIPDEQTVILGSTVVLDGSNSLPPTDRSVDELSYQWTLVEQPEIDVELGEAPIQLSDDSSAQAGFLAEKIGVYRATLVVSHGERSSTAETVVMVNAGNSQPLLSIDAPEGSSFGTQNRLFMPATLRQSLVLDGSASSDPDGDTLTHRWLFPTNALFPFGSAAVIGNANGAIAEFVPDVAGDYTVDYTIYDGYVPVTQRVVVQVRKAEDDTVNTAPVLVNLAFSSSGTQECELGGTSTAFPFCNVSAGVWDAEGDPLTYAWTYWNAATPEERLTQNEATLRLDGTPAGVWQVELVVSDGQAESNRISATLEIKVGANRRPTAAATVNAVRALAGERLTFDGSASTDPDGDRLTYHWTLIDRPDGSSAVLQQDGGVDDPVAYVNTDQAGRYVAQLEVRDHPPGGGESMASINGSSAAGFAKIGNNPPMISRLWMSQEDVAPGQSLVQRSTRPGQNANAVIGANPFALIFDPDFDSPLDWLLTVIRSPEGSSIVQSQSLTGQAAPDGVTPRRIGGTGASALRADLAGEYEYELIVSDGVAFSEPKRLAFTLIPYEDYPTLLVERGTANTNRPEGSSNSPVAPEAFTNFVGQALFPIRAESLSRASLPRGIIQTHYFRLTAFDRDYTIADLETSSAGSCEQPVFNGLQNGQVIRQGEPVRFSISKPLLPNEYELINALQALRDEHGANSDEVTIETQRQEQIVSDCRYTWLFGVAENPEFTFYYGVAE
jgi:hypothetical protein